MTKPFYIPELPAGAEYCSRQALAETYAPDMDQILNEIQMVDDRWSADDIQRICSTPSRPELAAFFEIEDFHEIPGSFEALRSMSLFALNGVPVDPYVDGVEYQVRNVHSNYPEILFRYYVSGEMWEALAKRGLIGLPEVEFVRMRHSSADSRIGTFWRLMGLNDDRFEIAFTSDVEDPDDFNPQMPYLRQLTENRAKPFDLCGSIIFLREEMDYLEKGSQKDELQIFHYTDLHGDGIFIQSISSLNRFSGKDFIRGGGEPLPELVPLICEYFASQPQQRIYHPQTNRWAVFQEREPRLGAGQYGFMNEFFPRLLTKAVPMRMTIQEARYFALVRIFRRYGENCLLRRLYHQLSMEGHEIVIPHNTDDTSQWSTIEDNLYLEKKDKNMLGKNFKRLEPKQHDISRKIVDQLQDEINKDVYHPGHQKLSLMSPDEQVMLYEIALGLHNHPDTRGCVLEFGSWCGASAFLLTKAMLKRDDGCLPVVTVDPYRYTPSNPFDPTTVTYLEARRMHERFGDEIYYGLVRVITEDLNFLRIWNKPIRMLFIDTTGQYKHTKDELELALPHLVDDSWLLFHDYFGEENQGLIDAVDEFIATQKEWELEPYRLVEEITLYHSLVGLHMIKRL